MAVPVPVLKGTTYVFALVDAEDYERVAPYRWYERDGYARANVPRRTRRVGSFLMHRMVLGLEIGDKRVADHINRNRMDNRRENLRIIEKGRNGDNQGSARTFKGVPVTSKHRGVSFHKFSGLWMAHASSRGERYCQYFKTEQQAADAAAAWRRQHMPFSTN